MIKLSYLVKHPTQTDGAYEGMKVWSFASVGGITPQPGRLIVSTVSG